MFKNIIFILSISLFFSCSKNNDVNNDGVEINKGGVFIANEGNFSVANSSLSYYYPSASKITNSIFYQVNNVPLGDVAQSITINNQLIYVVINNSGLIYAIDSKTLEFKGKINDLTSPREIIFINDQKAYVSDLYSSAITIVNPVSYEITGTIELGKSSDCMVKFDDKVMVANWSAYNQTGINNTIMVVDSDTDVVSDSIVVGIEPNSMVIDKEDHLWVLCSGGFMNDEMPTLWKINPQTLEILKQLTFTDIQNSPDNLCINGTGDSLYFLNNGVFAMSINSQQLPDNVLIDEANRNYYSLGVHPVEKDIYVSDALDYNRNGMVYRYSSNGILISSFEVGIIPGYFAFN
ncbi:MAG: YncE family protein [Bacteroidota bacterium]